jgi:DNA-binding MarR family transcriptional regulator
MTVTGAQLWQLNHRLLTVVLSACTAEMAQMGLDSKEFFVLAEVEVSPYPAELAEKLVIPKASMTVYVRSLVAKGFIVREIDDADLRRHRLAITARGIEVRDRSLAALSAEFDRRLSGVSAEDREHLRATLLAVLDQAG